MARNKRIQCVVCEYTEPYDANLELKGLLCPECGRDTTMMIVTPSKPTPTKPVGNHKYQYLASNSKQEWHDIKTSFSGEVEAASEIGAYHKLKEKYKDCIILGKAK